MKIKVELPATCTRWGKENVLLCILSFSQEIRMIWVDENKKTTIGKSKSKRKILTKIHHKLLRTKKKTEKWMVTEWRVFAYSIIYDALHICIYSRIRILIHSCLTLNSRWRPHSEWFLASNCFFIKNYFVAYMLSHGVCEYWNIHRRKWRESSSEARKRMMMFIKIFCFINLRWRKTKGKTSFNLLIKNNKRWI